MKVEKKERTIVTIFFHTRNSCHYNENTRFGYHATKNKKKSVASNSTFLYFNKNIRYRYCLTKKNSMHTILHYDFYNHNIHCVYYRTKNNGMCIIHFFFIYIFSHVITMRKYFNIV